MNGPDGIDLHSHSHYSDGALSPAELVARAAAAGVHTLALTDHDCLAGLGEARAAGERLGVRMIDGVEISAGWRAQTVHVLGLWLDPGHEPLHRHMAEQERRRLERIEQMCQRLERLRLPGTALREHVLGCSGVITRTHLARAMVEAGLARHVGDAFHRYLGQGKPAYRRVEWPSLAEAVSWIRAAGGHAVLAHPLRYRLSGGARRALLSEFRDQGGTGLEVVSGSNPGQPVETAAALAQQFGLAGTVGSDFHDPNLPWNPLGRLAKLPARIMPLWDQARQAT